MLLRNFLKLCCYRRQEILIKNYKDLTLHVSCLIQCFVDKINFTTFEFHDKTCLHAAA